MKCPVIKATQTTPDKGEQDVTPLVASATLSGSYTQCCRTLALEILVSPDGGRIPYIYFALGATMQFYAEGKLLFYGVVVSKDKSADAATMTVTCFDRGFYLKNNDATYNFKGQTPETITRRVCADFGIGVGSVPATGIALSRKFRGAALYSILDTVWTLAGDKNGKKYCQRFAGAMLTVEEKRAAADQTIKQGENLISASYSESIEQMVNRVGIYDADGKLLRSVSDDAAVRTYGLLRRVLTATKDDDKDDDKADEARRMLADGGIDRRVTVRNLGDTSLMTGGAVQVYEPYTGLTGLFWIDGDEHRWTADGTYENKLTLNFRNIMREGSVGQEDK